jgi:hypothetical protein
MKKHLKFAGYVVATLLVVSSITLSRVANVLVEALEEQPS